MEAWRWVAASWDAGERTWDFLVDDDVRERARPRLVPVPFGLLVLETDEPRLYPEEGPGAVPLTPHGVLGRTAAAVVWTGAELVVWGGEPTDPADPVGARWRPHRCQTPARAC
jgi:hypothetical protein